MKKFLNVLLIFSKQYFLTLVLAILLVLSTLNQTIFISSFDQAKQAAARWPMLSKPHLQLAEALFETSTLGSTKELKLAEKSFLKNPQLMAKTGNLVNQPRQISSQISFWENKISEGLNNPQVYLDLSILSYQIYNDQKAVAYWQTAFYLDPSNASVPDIKEIIRN